MTMTQPTLPTSRAHLETWKWYICVLLMLATVVNYMDRLTVNTLAIEIQHEFRLNDEQYGQLELGFGLAFAAGSLFFGWLVDRIGVYALYPVVLLGWSAMGFLTGLSRSFHELLVLRILLGLFEAGHFPCGLKTVQVILAPRDRAMGNSLLQSGTALGAILAPQVIRMLLREGESGWRPPFLVIGAGGCCWVFLWLFSIRPAALRARPRGRTGVAVLPAGGTGLGPAVLPPDRVFAPVPQPGGHGRLHQPELAPLPRLAAEVPARGAGLRAR